ncbi:hypothetical protein, partial [uncultured Marinobacter sp.]|uniref:hypothetical protein n=1 Tax=uncultured Marinobacter sp. TaxID=187379 RepID=UPI0030DAF5D7
QLAFNQLVEGSNPSRPTNKPECLRAIRLKKRAFGLFFFCLSGHHLLISPGCHSGLYHGYIAGR